MPKLRNLANRTKELELFLKMAGGQHDCSIMLVEGKSGMGKTSLLNRFRQQCPETVAYVPFDCKGVDSIASFLSEVVVDLGRERFQTFSGKVKLFVQGGVDFSENDIAARDAINIAINSSIDLATQQYRLAELQQAFFQDLASFDSRLVVTLDTYQEASESLRDWIESKWLRAVSRQLHNVATVIAGQDIPDPNNSVWGDDCEHIPLTPIIEVKAWCDFCSDLPDSALPEEAIKAIALGCKGHPANVHQMLSVAIKSWSA
ncbi:ATP-binding protein [Leptolyngbya iicbica]|uniref:ATP-binding protein n=2 Tax=Cyanophyceae TaxID=3028117 RepID=A0A4Q7E440_9CYAN|nr:ATP-binding protein [Leptolyngbya sp. LK]RZM76598.1 ATP-binding protein [Leptolyngbya sp. LK]